MKVRGVKNSQWSWIRVPRRTTVCGDRQVKHAGQPKSASPGQGMAVTVDGIGKGYIVDEGTAVLREHGFPNVLVEAGGDLLAAGKKNPDTIWQIGIQSPRPTGRQLLAKSGVENGAVATSVALF